MRAVRRALTILVYLAPLALLAGLGALMVRRYVRDSEKALTPIVAHEATRALGREVRVGSVKLGLFGASAEGVAVAERRTIAASGVFVSARRVSADYDLYRLLRGQDPQAPIVPRLVVEQPYAHLVRDPQKRWNFDELIKPRGKPSGRQSLGVVEVSGGNLDYEDASLPRNPKRPGAPFRASLTRLNGTLTWHADQSVSWVGEGDGVGGWLRHAASRGTYEPVARRLFIHVDADRFALVQLNRMLPPDVSFEGGTASGRVTVMRTPDMKVPLPVDVQGDLTVAGGVVRTSHAAEPAVNIRGAATVSNDMAALRVDTDFAGSPLHAEGLVANIRHPAISGWATGTGVQLQRALAALKMQGRFPILRDVQATADIRADLRGPVNDLSIGIKGPARIGGALPSGASAPAQGGLQVAFSGPLSDPRVMVTGTLPVVRYKDYEARALWISGVYSRRRSAADFSANVAGGTVRGRVELAPAAAHGRYSLVARARSIDLAKLPLGGGKPVGGLAQLDVVARGSLDSSVPSGRANVQVSGLRYDKYSLQDASASLRSAGGVVHLQPLTLRDPAGYVVARGTMNARTRALDVQLEADGIDLARLPLPVGKSPAEHDPNAAPGVQGVAYLREGHIGGSLTAPEFSGQLRAYAVGYGKYSLDYIAAEIAGNRDAVSVRSAEAYRFPASVTAVGTVRNPFSPRATLEINGSFQRAPMQDLLALGMENPPDFHGVAHGTFEVVGPLRRPRVTAPDVVVERATLGDYTFDSVAASLEYDGSSPDALVQLSRFEAKLGQATLTGRVTLARDMTFHAEAHAADVPLSLVQPAVVEYAALQGAADITADVTGAIRDGKAQDLRGSAALNTSGLVLNDQKLGELHARLALAGDTVTAPELDLAAGTERLLDVTGLQYNRQTGTISARGSLNAMRIEALRQTLAASPYVAAHPDSPAAVWLKPLANPFQGTMDVGFAVRGTTEQPVADITWAGRDMVIEKQDIQEFTGAVTVDRTAVRLTRAALRADDTAINAHGAVVLDKSLSGELELNNLPLPVLKRWFPTANGLAGLTGTADLVYVEAAGTPSAPDLTISVELSKVAWQSRDMLGGRPVQVERVSVSRAHIAEGRIAADDVRVTLLGAPPAAPPGSKTPVPAPAAARYQVSASGNMEFHWKAPYLPEDPRLDLDVNVRDQGLGILTAFVPNPNAQMEGRVSASFHWGGTLREPDIDGRLTVTQAPGERIRYASMTTALTGLNASFTFNGDRMHVDRFTARTQVINTRDNTVVKSSDPISLSGDLALHDGVAGAPGLRLTAPKLVIAEAPLPGLTSGRLVTDGLALDLTVAGTVTRPRLGGSVQIARTDFRMPDTLAGGGQGVLLPVLPRFDVSFSLGNDVRVSTAQLSAYVHTEPGEPVVVRGSVDQPSINGSLVVDKGTLSFPTARFAIQKGGTVTLRYPSYALVTAPGSVDEPSLGITVDVTATTQLTAASMSGRMKRYTITVEARGPINMGAPLQISDPNSVAANPFGERGLVLSFRSDPADLASSPGGMQQRITGLLGGQAAIQGLFSRNADVGRILGDQLTDILSASLLPDLMERIGIGRALGFEELSVDYNRVDAFTLRVSRQLAGPFYVSYWRLLSNSSHTSSLEPEAWELKLSYRLPGNWQFSWTTDDQRTNAYLLEGVFKF